MSTSIITEMKMNMKKMNMKININMVEMIEITKLIIRIFIMGSIWTQNKNKEVIFPAI